MTEYLNNFYDKLPPVSYYIEKYELNALKSLGQNFILDLNITNKIAKNLNDISNSVILEIGSGPCGLTRAILHQNPKKLIAIEFDKRAIEILHELQKVYKDKLVIINADALQVDYNELKQQYAKHDSFKICANLPYNISIPLTIKWLYHTDIIDQMLLMYQLEVGNRITAKPDSKDYGRISVMSSLNYNTNILFKVSKSCFVPQPKITSCIVNFEKKLSYPTKDELLKIENLVKIAFSQRRKMLKTTLLPAFKNQNEMDKILTLLNISGKNRAENLTPEQFYELSKYVL